MKLEIKTKKSLWQGFSLETAMVQIIDNIFIEILTWFNVFKLFLLKFSCHCSFQLKCDSNIILCEQTVRFVVILRINLKLKVHQNFYQLSLFPTSYHLFSQLSSQISFVPNVRKWFAYFTIKLTSRKWIHLFSLYSWNLSSSGMWWISDE